MGFYTVISFAVTPFILKPFPSSFCPIRPEAPTVRNISFHIRSHIEISSKIYNGFSTAFRRYFIHSTVATSLYATGRASWGSVRPLLLTAVGQYRAHRPLLSSRAIPWWGNDVPSWQSSPWLPVPLLRPFSHPRPIQGHPPPARRRLRGGVAGVVLHVWTPWVLATCKINTHDTVQTQSARQGQVQEKQRCGCWDT